MLYQLLCSASIAQCSKSKQPSRYSPCGAQLSILQANTSTGLPAESVVTLAVAQELAWSPPQNLLWQA